MANLLWGKVYYKNVFAGILREEPGDRTSFEYDTAYLKANYPAIAHTLPTIPSVHISQSGLHPFFDNLVAEGWLAHAQTRLLGTRHASRFELLLAFGYDCAGAVSILDPEPAKLTKQLDKTDPKEIAVLTSHASLSGVQPKLVVIARDGKYYPTHPGELSTHIAKFVSQEHNDLVINEYLSSLAFKAFLPDEEHVDLSIEPIEEVAETALLIKRFDRTPEGQRIHFEEFNQLLNRKSSAKYDGSYAEMSHFIRSTSDCLPIENYRLYSRILVGLLIGNTDMHFKNFAMFHTPAGLRLTPSYDQVAASLYKYNTIALSLSNTSHTLLHKLKPRHLIALADNFALPIGALEMLFKQLKNHKEAAKDVIAAAPFGTNHSKDQLIKLMEARWNGTFALIGQTLSKKP